MSSVMNDFDFCTEETTMSEQLGMFDTPIESKTTCMDRIILAATLSEETTDIEQWISLQSLLQAVTYWAVTFTNRSLDSLDSYERDALYRMYELKTSCLKNFGCEFGALETAAVLLIEYEGVREICVDRAINTFPTSHLYKEGFSLEGIDAYEIVKSAFR